MFSQELENLIQATLEDGVLEEFEKAALVKRAQAEGVDLAELEIYINSILQKRQKELEKEKNAKIERHAKEKKEAFGRVCPNCGKQVPPMTLKCECGYEFSGSASASSVQLLLEKIETIQSSSKELKDKEKSVRDTIEMFPVPNTKEDIIEFLSLAAANLNKKVSFINTRLGRTIIYLAPFLFVVFLMIVGNTDVQDTCIIFLLIPSILVFIIPIRKLSTTDGVLQEMRIKSWRTKFEQVILKGRSMRGDPDFQKQLDYYENIANKKY